MKAPNTPEDRSPAFPGLALGGLRSVLRSVRDATGAGGRSGVKIPEDRSPALPALVLDGLRSILSSFRGGPGESPKIELNMPDDRSPALSGLEVDGLRSLFSSTRSVTGAAYEFRLEFCVAVLLRNRSGRRIDTELALWVGSVLR